MNGLRKWLLVPAVLLVGMAFVRADRAAAARWRAHVHYPSFHYPSFDATHVHRYA